MFGHNRNSGIHTLSNYNEAHHAWETTKPIRGRKEEVRPLGHRRNVDQYQIRKTESGAIECVLYKTPVVTYLTDGRLLIKDDGWKSVSTAYFIEEVLGIGAQIYNRDLNVCLPCGNYSVGDGLELGRVDETGRLKPLNPKTTTVHAINRKGANIVRARYKGFTNYVNGMLKLRTDELITLEEFQQAGAIKAQLDANYSNSFPEYVRSFFALVDDTNPETQTNSWYVASLALLKSFGRWHYRLDGVSVKDTHKIMRKFDELVLGLNRNECFLNKELPLGEIKRDTYSKYFQSGWKRLHADQQKN